MKMRMNRFEYEALYKFMREIDKQDELDPFVMDTSGDEVLMIEVAPKEFLLMMNHMKEQVGFIRPILIELIEFMINDDNATEVMMDYIKRSIGCDFEAIMDMLALSKKEYQIQLDKLRLIEEIKPN